MQTRTEKQNAIWGGIVLVLGLLILLDWYFELSPWIWVAGLALLGFLPFAALLGDRSDWRWLILAYVLWAIALLIALIQSNALPDDYTAVFVLSVIALPFLLVYLRNRMQWWALIPAYTLAAIALMIALETAGVISDELVAAYVMFAIALPFFTVYLWNRRQWWALIPAGIMAIIGASFLIAGGAGEFIIALALLAVGTRMLVRTYRGGRPPTEAAPSSPEAPEASEPEEGGPPLD